jgi:hypothetical protein
MIPTSRIAQLAAATVAGAVLATGGYALASGTSKTIHGCVSKTTHVLTIRKRCTRSQTGLNWNQRGPAGSQGQTGQTGPAGQPGSPGQDAVGAWAHIVETSTSATVTAGENINVQRATTGEIDAVITGGSCVKSQQAIIATPEPVGSTAAGNVPVAYVSQAPEGSVSFGIYLGTEQGGVFTPQDGSDDVNVAVYCATS